MTIFSGIVLGVANARDARTAAEDGHGRCVGKKATELAPDVREREWIERIRRSDVPAFEAMMRACGPRLAP